MSKECTYMSFGSIDSDICFSEIPSPCSSLNSKWSKDECFSDVSDQPVHLDLKENSHFPFHVAAVKNGHHPESMYRALNKGFTPGRRKKSQDKFNHRGRHKTLASRNSIGSLPSSPRSSMSLSGISSGGSVASFHETIYKTETMTPARSTPALNVISVDVRNKNKHTGTNTTQLISRGSNIPDNRRYSTPLENIVPLTSSSPHTGHVCKPQNGRVKILKDKIEAHSKKENSKPASSRKNFFNFRKNAVQSSPNARTGGKIPLQISPQIDETYLSSKSTELSTDVNLPGILKIFGDAISPGANYKSVLATKSSNAKELLKLAIERYGIDRHNVKDYVLCEVVGREENNNVDVMASSKAKTKKMKRKSVDFSVLLSSESSLFVEDYIRPLNDHEKPLILQSYWKPLDGHSRRFEIRKRSQVFKKEEKDHATRDINMQARRLVMQKSKNNLVPTLLNQSQSDSEDNDEGVRKTALSDSSSNCSTRDSSDQCVPAVPASTSLNDEYQNKRERNRLPDIQSCPKPMVEKLNSNGISSDRGDAKGETKCDTNCLPNPYLITLQGNEDTLVHSLDCSECMIGSDEKHFKLIAPDVLDPHCVIRKQLEVFPSKTNDTKGVKHWNVVIKPLSSAAEVRINGRKITSQHTLEQGELVSIGRHHMFMFKDPTSNVNLSSVVNYSFSNSKEYGVNSTGKSLDYNISGNFEDREKFKNQFLSPSVDGDLKFSHDQEGSILDEIFGSAINFFDVSANCTLAPAALLCQCITHSCLNFEPQHKTDFLRKITTSIENLVLNATKEVSLQKVLQSQSSTKSSEPSNNYQDVYYTLRPVVFWMSNSLEMFGFLQKDLITIIQKKEQEKSNCVLRADVLAIVESFMINNEILAQLEDIIMYAFQQIVYHLTKILHELLPTILKSNPFSEGGLLTSKVSNVTDVYDRALEMLKAYDVHGSIRDQLFSYLFFFTNISLFNFLMKDESCAKYFCWEKGVRIRGNLELIEEWAAEHGYAKQCSVHMEKISTLANLLATPRSQLIKSSWASLRENFPYLSPAQLNKVLNSYHNSGIGGKPKSWRPDNTDWNEIVHKGLIMESFDNHPSLMLPVSRCRIIFHKLSSHSRFQQLFQRVKFIAATSKSCNAIHTDQRTDLIRKHPDGGEALKSGRTCLNGNDINQQNFRKSNGLKTEKRNADAKIFLTDSQIPLSRLRKKREIALNEKKYSKKASIVNGKQNRASSSSYSEPELQSLSSDLHPIQKCHKSTKNCEVISGLALSGCQGRESGKVVVLPVSETPSLASHLSANSNLGKPCTPPSSSTTIQTDLRTDTCNHIYNVNVKRVEKGIGLALIDGAHSSIGMPGVYVGSFLPDGQATEQKHTKYEAVLRCWPQEGKLQLGDRILSANGVSLINMSYEKAMKAIQEAGTNIQFHVVHYDSEAAANATKTS